MEIKIDETYGRPKIRENQSSASPVFCGGAKGRPENVLVSARLRKVAHFVL